MLVRRGGDPEFVKLIDFGVAQFAGQVKHHTAAGMVLGNPSYMSPEAARGQRVDGRADLYSVGIMLFEMLTGAPPFRGATQAATIEMHLHQKPPSVAGDHGHGEVPRVLVDVVRRCLQKSPDDRFDDAESLRAALLDAAERRRTPSARCPSPRPTTTCRAASSARRGACVPRAPPPSSPARRSAWPPATGSRSRCADRDIAVSIRSRQRVQRRETPPACRAALGCAMRLVTMLLFALGGCGNSTSDGDAACPPIVRPGFNRRRTASPAPAAPPKAAAAARTWASGATISKPRSSARPIPPGAARTPAAAPAAARTATAGSELITCARLGTRPDLLQRADHRLELIEIVHREGERVDRAAVVGRAAVRLGDVDALVGERLRDVREQARLVGAQHLDRDLAAAA